MHSSPWNVIFRLMAFNSETGWYRLYQWELLWPFVEYSPWVGYGEGRQLATQTGLTASIDSHWLSLAIIFGVPVSISSLLIFFGACTKGTSGFEATTRLSVPMRRVSLALSVTMVIYVILGATVAFWGAVYMIGTLLAGIRASIGALSRA